MFCSAAVPRRSALPGHNTTLNHPQVAPLLHRPRATNTATYPDATLLTRKVASGKENPRHPSDRAAQAAPLVARLVRAARRHPRLLPRAGRVLERNLPRVREPGPRRRQGRGRRRRPPLLLHFVQLHLLQRLVLGDVLLPLRVPPCGRHGPAGYTPDQRRRSPGSRPHGADLPCGAQREKKKGEASGEKKGRGAPLTGS